MATVTTSGVWTSVGKELPRMQGLSSNHLSWGQPYRYRNLNPGQKQSSYQFDGVSAVPVLLDGTEFKLGTFTHFNFNLEPFPNPQFTTNLKVTMNFDGGLTREFNFTFAHNETPNVPGPVPDEVVLPTLQSKETVNLGGTEYAVHITGFKQDGHIVTKFLSQEDRANSADIFAKLVAVPVVKPVPPPPPPPGEIKPEPPPVLIPQVIEHPEPKLPRPAECELPPPKPAPTPTEEQCRVKQVVSTSTLFTATLERLNRRSVLGLLEQLIAEVNEHCEQGITKAPTPGEQGELGKLRAELLLLITTLQKTTDSHVNEVNILKQQLTSLQINLNQTIQQTVNQTIQNINIEDLLQQIERLNIKLQLVQKAAQELDDKELNQIDILIQKLLKTTDLSTVIQNIQINVDGRSFNLLRLIEVVTTVDQVVSIKLQYTNEDPDLGDIAGACFTLTDKTTVIFNVRIIEQPSSPHLTYVFETRDWKGLPAQFSLLFSRRTRSYKLCKRSVSLNVFDGLEQTNIVFDLCPQIAQVARPK